MTIQDVKAGFRNWRNWPILNFFISIFGAEPPMGSKEDPAAAVKNLLNTISLVAALMLTIACAVPTGVDYEELTDADARYMYDDGKYACSNWGSISSLLANDLLASIYALGISMLMAIIMLISLGEIDAYDRAFFARWWKFQKLLIFLSFFGVAIGALFCFLTVDKLIKIKFPNYYLERQCAAGVSEPRMDTDSNGNPAYLIYVIGVYTFIPVIMMAFVISGFAQMPPVSPPEIKKQSIEVSTSSPRVEEHEHEIPPTPNPNTATSPESLDSNTANTDSTAFSERQISIVQNETFNLDANVSI